MACPNKTSGLDSDISENTLRDIFSPTGLVDNKVCAIDDTWSGRRFVVRRGEPGRMATLYSLNRCGNNSSRVCSRTSAPSPAVTRTRFTSNSDMIWRHRPQG